MFPFVVHLNYIGSYYHIMDKIMVAIFFLHQKRLQIKPARVDFYINCGLRIISKKLECFNYIYNSSKEKLWPMTSANRHLCVSSCPRLGKFLEICRKSVLIIAKLVSLIRAIILGLVTCIWADRSWSVSCEFSRITESYLRAKWISVAAEWIEMTLSALM